MKSATRGKSTSGTEVTNISGHGFWLLMADEELFVSFKEFPWFKDASVSEILNVEWPQPPHLYWPGLDVDLVFESSGPEVFTSPKKNRQKNLAKQHTQTPKRRWASG